MRKIFQLLLVCLTGLGIQSGLAQDCSFNGPFSVGAGSTWDYDYTCISSTPDIPDVNVTGGTIISTVPITRGWRFRIQWVADGFTTSGQIVLLGSTYNIQITYPQFILGALTASQTLYTGGTPSLLQLGAPIQGICGGPSYNWYSSTDGTNFTLIAGVNGTNYQPAALTVTTWYYVSGSCGTTGTSNQVKITVYQSVNGGSITPASSSVVTGNSPGQLTLGGVSGGDLNYSYDWRYTTGDPNDLSSYQSLGLGANVTSYTPGALTQNTAYRVWVTSYGHTAVSSPAVISVFPHLQAGTISGPSTAISSQTFSLTNVGLPSGGTCSGAFAYQWWISTDGGVSFSQVVGQNNSDASVGPFPVGTVKVYRVALCGTEQQNSNVLSVDIVPEQPNYIKTRTINRPGIVDKASADALTDRSDVQQTTVFYDGLGRAMQTVDKQASPLGYDRVAPLEYDPFGREAKHYLPYIAAESNGAFKASATQDQSSFNSAQFPGEQTYYGQTNFEASPLNRPVQELAPGISWVGSGRGIGTSYLFNTNDDNVQIWAIDFLSGSLPVNAGAYQSGTLYKTVTADEQGHNVIEYKDLDGHSVLKKVQLADLPGIGHSGWLCTYYVYDDMNHLRYVIPPKAVDWLSANAWNFMASGGDQVASELCFRYEYDARNRMVVKKVPGKGEEWMVYDSRDRMVFSQDPNQRAQGQWINTQYDQLNRMVLVGQMNYSAIRTDLQQTVSNAGATGAISPIVAADLYLATPDMQGDMVATDAVDMWDGFSTLAGGGFSAGVVQPGTVTTGYPAGALPISLNPIPGGATVQPLIINYYDNYDWVSATGSGLGTALATDNTGNPKYFITGYNESPVYAVPIATSPVVRGQVTGTMHLILGENRPLYTVNFYDDRDRLIQSRSTNYTGGVDTRTSQYDFSGKQLRSLLTHYKAGPVAQYHSVLTKLEYDPGFRPLQVWKNIDDAAQDQLITTLKYNELGQLQTKQLGNNLDNLNYAYNIRGWLTSINKDYISSSNTTPINYFGMELGYDKTQASASGASYKNLQFSGNIAGAIWKSAGDGVNRQYDFSYDNVNRLTAANFSQYDLANPNSKMDFSVSNLTYDANGNIQKMQQNGWKLGGSVPIDMLTYTYGNSGGDLSNKLRAVTEDPTIGSMDNKLGDFTDRSSGTDDYGYDLNGNLTADQNKGISNIIYNYLNLPQQITITGKGTITYTYDATGNKLKKVTVDNLVNPAKTTTTSYIDGIVYENDNMQFISHEEGRARWALHNNTDGTSFYGWEYDFFEKDHLGNTRVVLTQEKSTAQYVATMETTYRDKEKALFSNIDETSYPTSSVPGGYPDDNTPPQPNQYVARVNGSVGGQKIGPALLLKVMSGDAFDIGTKSFFRSGGSAGTNNNSVPDLLNSLAQGLIAIASPGHGAVADLNNTSGSPLYAALNSFMAANDLSPTDRPKAYLNWMLLDNQFNYVQDGSGAIQVQSADIINTLAKHIDIHHSGFLYIWVSNETPNWDVFFDNLNINHYAGPMLEETHYYPFGLTMAGISDKALKGNYAENKYRFNDGTELANKEFSDGSGLEMYETDARGYDPQIGRFWQIDPLGDINENYSPYAFSNNNPILYNDPLGMDTAHYGDPAYVTALKKGQDSKPDIAAEFGPAPTSAAAPINSVSPGDGSVEGSSPQTAGALTLTLFELGEKGAEITVTGVESLPFVAAGVFVYGVARLSRPYYYQEPAHVPSGDISGGLPKPYIPNDLAKKLAAGALAVAGEKTLEELIPGSLKRSPSWHEPYAKKTPSEIRQLAKEGDQKAKKMKKLLDQVDRLLDKNKNK